jgi:aminoacyl-tRNA hydrolase
LRLAAVSVHNHAKRAYRPAGALVGAQVRRQIRRRLTMVGVTGSCGKTTTKDLIATILATRHGVVKSAGEGNALKSVVSTVLRAAGGWHRFGVQELGATGPNSLDELLAVTQPDIGVVTSIGDDHISAFQTREGTAREKAKLITSLPAHGCAILNADDPLVAAMATVSPAPVLTFGVRETASVRAIDVQGCWPERLSFTVQHGGEAMRVRTRLCGLHWVSSVLAAIATGVACGIPLQEAAAAVERVDPWEGRMSPALDGHGVTFIRDDWKAPLWTFGPAFDFMRDAEARRKIVIVGTISDLRGDPARKYAGVARRAAEVADYVFFVGPWSSRALRARRGPDDDTIRAFASVKAAHAFCQTFLRAGDLVLLKGSNPADHLVRIVLARRREVACWRDRCVVRGFCDHCGLLTVRSEPAIAVRHETATSPAAANVRLRREGSVCVVIGLGNPGPQFAGTRHNVGYDVVDRLAGPGASWEQVCRGSIARLTISGIAVELVKLAVQMNDTGNTLRQLLEAEGFGPEDCLLIYDDMDLAVGDVRFKAKGSDGGHRGVRSIIHALETESLRRIKIGVGRPTAGAGGVGHVLSRFTGEERVAVDRAYETAVRELHRLLATEAKQRERRMASADAGELIAPRSA